MFTAIRVDEDEVARDVADLKRTAKGYGREIGVFTNVYVVCRPTAKEAEEYHHWYAVELADKEAVETMVVERGLDRENVPDSVRRAFRVRAGGGNGAWPVVGDPDRWPRRWRGSPASASPPSPWASPTISTTSPISATRSCPGWNGWG